MWRANPGSMLGKLVRGAYTGFGTRPHQALVWWLATSIAFTALVSSDKRNVRAGTALIEAFGAANMEQVYVPDATGAPTIQPSEWHLRNAVGLTLSYAVPMAQLSSNERWELSDHPVANSLPVPASLLGMLLQVLGWLFLSPSLIAIAARLVRGVKNR